MLDVEQRLRDLLTDDHLAISVRAGAADAVHAGVRRRRRHARLTGAAAMAVAGAVAGLVVAPIALRPATRPATGTITGEAPILKPSPITPLPLASASALAVSGGVVWVAGPEPGVAGADLLMRVDAATRHVTRTPLGVVSDLAATPLHLWVALRPGVGDPSHCTLESRKTSSAGLVSTYPLPCDAAASSGPIVTANGGHAWVATDDGTSTHLRLYSAGSRALQKEVVLPGRLTGTHLLAIGGSSVYVVTASADGRAVLHELSAADLTSRRATDVTGARLMAFGSHRLYVANETSVVSYQPDLSDRRTLVAARVTMLTTGNDLVWCDAHGNTPEGLAPLTGDVMSVAEANSDPTGIVRADRDLLWIVRSFDGVGVGVESAQAAAS